MGLLDGKKALIFGVANEKSIAWAIAEAFRKEGAEVALTYANEAIAKRVIPLAESIGATLTSPATSETMRISRRSLPRSAGSGGGSIFWSIRSPLPTRTNLKVRF